MISIGFIQETDKRGLTVKRNYGIPPDKLCGKTLEGNRGQTIKDGPERPPEWAAWPSLEPPRLLLPEASSTAS